MDVIIVLGLFLLGGIVFFIGMGLFLIIVAYFVSLFIGKKAIKSPAPRVQETPAKEEKPLKIA